MEQLSSNDRVTLILAIIAFVALGLGLLASAFLWVRARQRSMIARALPEQSMSPLSTAQIAEEALALVDQVRAENARLKSQLAAQPQSGSLTTELPRVSLAEIATALNVAIIGPKGSGKTTTMTALLALRSGYVEALDPHNEPGKWPCAVIGGGERFAVIHAHLLAGYSTMRSRYGASDRGERSQATYQTTAWRMTFAGDEWGGIVGELPDIRATKDRPAIPGAGSLLGKLIARGRKVGIGMLIAAHDDTAGQFGLDGEMGLVACFDWLIYLGGQATGNTNIPVSVRQAAQRMARPAVALDTERHRWCLLTLDTIHHYQPPSGAPAPIPPDFAAALQHPAAHQQQQLLLELMSGQNGFSVQRPAEPLTQRSGRSDEGSANVQRSAFNAQPADSTSSEAAERLNTNGDTNAPATADELRRLGVALRLFAESGRKAESICQAFGVTKGGSKGYRRAVWLFEQAASPTHEEEPEPAETDDAARRAVAA